MTAQKPGPGEEILFKEEQSAAQTWWPLLLIPLALYLFIQFGYGLYAQLVMGKPFGNPPLSDGWLAALSLLMIALGATLIWGGFKIKLSVVVTDQGLYLSYFPFMKRFFRRGDIISSQAVTYRPILDYGGWGLRWNFRDRGRGYTMSGNRGVMLQLAQGKPVLIGSALPEELAEALDRAISPA